MTKKKLEDAYEHITYGDAETTGVHKFIKDWTSCNDSIRKYDDMEIYPKPSSCPANIFNMWIPFAMESETEHYEKNEEGLQFMLNHIRILCNNEESVFQYFIFWIAQMIQYPETKTIIPCLISKQGAGKGSLLELLRQMLGEDKVWESTAPSRDVWGNFNGLMVDAFLVNLNELSKSELHQSEGKFKALVTDKQLTINDKGISAFKITSYHRFIITTNMEDPIKTQSDDRRNFIIRSSDEKCGDKAYFNQMYTYLKDIGVIRSCYDYFKSIPGMDNFNDLVVPATEYQNELKKLNRSHIESWLEDFTRENSDKDEVKIKSEEVYYRFRDWCTVKQIKYEVNSLKFCVQMKNLKIDGIETEHSKAGNKKRFDIPKLKEYFKIDSDTDDEVEEVVEM